MNYNDKVMDVIDEVKKVVIGKDVCIAKIMAAIIAGGNILMDDVPGVGKTTMALAFANAMGLQNKRVQFTPDVLPGDITGFTMYDKATNQFVYRPGAVMCNLFLADEINRTSPGTCDCGWSDISGSGSIYSNCHGEPYRQCRNTASS